MSVRKQIVTALITAVLALVALSATASAQCGPGTSGSNRISIAVASDDFGQTSYNFFNFDFFSRIRTWSLYSWGHGPVGHPGNVRSSDAVLRERLGLMR